MNLRQLLVFASLGVLSGCADGEEIASEGDDVSVATASPRCTSPTQARCLAEVGCGWDDNVGCSGPYGAEPGTGVPAGGGTRIFPMLNRRFLEERFRSFRYVE
ncbi:MAG: hypothetical protein KBF88_02865 [Polyangiaceae bacterium]|nr:hypothetical protein [Polyangiaceae bacterium]